MRGLLIAGLGFAVALSCRGVAGRYPVEDVL